MDNASGTVKAWQKRLGLTIGQPTTGVQPSNSLTFKYFSGFGVMLNQIALFVSFHLFCLLSKPITGWAQVSKAKGGKRKKPRQRGRQTPSSPSSPSSPCPVRGWMMVKMMNRMIPSWMKMKVNMKMEMDSIGEILIGMRRQRRKNIEPLPRIARFQTCVSKTFQSLSTTTQCPSQESCASLRDLVARICRLDHSLVPKLGG